jgi:hypothetical protein
MAEIGDTWKDVAGKAEALGLKLKLHLEQEQEPGDAPAPGDTKAMVEDLGRKVQDAFESVGNAAKDPAVHEDVKEMGRLFKDALMDTINTVGTEVRDRAASAAPSPDGPQDAVVDAEVIDDGDPGDEADGGD